MKPSPAAVVFAVIATAVMLEIVILSPPASAPRPVEAWKPTAAPVFVPAPLTSAFDPMKFCFVEGKPYSQGAMADGRECVRRETTDSAVSALRWQEPN